MLGFEIGGILEEIEWGFWRSEKEMLEYWVLVKRRKETRMSRSDKVKKNGYFLSLKSV